MNQHPKKTDGCLWLMLCAVFSIFLGVFLAIAFNIHFLWGIALAVVPVFFFTSKLLGIPSAPALLKQLFIISIVVFGGRFILKSLINFLKEVDTTEATFKPEEGIELSTLIEGNDTIPVYASHRVWKDNYGNNYQGTLTVRERDFTRLHNHIASFKFPNNGNFWGTLYDYMEQKDSPSLDLVMQTFQQIHQERKLNKMQFAEMVVSCIQDIPYSLVFQEECLPASYYEDSIKQVLEDCPACCIGGVPYGIQNPISFLQNLKGDCDTRTVLIYSILKYFNYDVAILNSDFYRHSIIGVNLPSKGIFKPYYGKKYVVWETTAKYYTPGKLPANFNDIKHWKVILTSK